MAKSAKVKRGSDENLFSISGAADALNRARRTIERALQGVPAAEVRSGLKLWAMSTIVRCLDERAQAPITKPFITNGRNGEPQVLVGVAAQCAIAFERYDKAQDKLQAIKTIEARRTFVRAELGPICREAIELMRQRDTANGLHEEHVQLRGEQIYRLMVRDVEGPCDWTDEQAWGVLDPPRPGDDDYDSAAA